MKTTLIAMGVIGLAFWLLAVIYPGSQPAIIVLAGALVAWSVFGLWRERERL